MKQKLETINIYYYEIILRMVRFYRMFSNYGFKRISPFYFCDLAKYDYLTKLPISS